jgi:hypothetical protein
MLDNLGPGTKIKFQPSDVAKVIQELAIPRETLGKDPEKICKLIQLGLSFFPDNNRVVYLKTESTKFLYNALTTALGILFTPKHFLPRSTKDIFTRIRDQIENEPPTSLAFSSRDIKEIQRILMAGRWTFMQFIEVGALYYCPILKHDSNSLLVEAT